MENELIGNDPLDIAIGGDAIAGTLAGAEVHLTKSSLLMTRSTVKADLTAIEADYNTYAAEAVTWGPASISDDGNIEYLGTLGEFRPTDALAPNEIHGGWIENTGGDLLWCFMFDNPLPMGTILDAILLTVRYRPIVDAGLINIIS